MKDFPIFTTDYGVSSLVLKEIPYKKVAYIRIRDAQQLQSLMNKLNQVAGVLKVTRPTG